MCGRKRQRIRHGTSRLKTGLSGKIDLYLSTQENGCRETSQGVHAERGRGTKPVKGRGQAWAESQQVLASVVRTGSVFISLIITPG